MVNLRIRLFFLILPVTGLVAAHAQETVPITGGNATGSGGSVSYSVGQMAYTTFAGFNGTVAQGVQQPYEITVLSTTVEPGGISLGFSVYPNPVTDYLQLKIDNYSKENLKYLLYNNDGQLLNNVKIVGSETRIFMNSLAQSIYFLKITKNDQEIKIFKIIKN